jgi:hypothetical protein
MVKSAAVAVCVVALALVAVSGPWIRSHIREAHLKRRMAAFGQRLAARERTKAHVPGTLIGAWRASGGGPGRPDGVYTFFFDDAGSVRTASRKVSLEADFFTD